VNASRDGRCDRYGRGGSHGALQGWLYRLGTAAAAIGLAAPGTLSVSGQLSSPAQAAPHRCVSTALATAGHGAVQAGSRWVKIVLMTETIPLAGNRLALVGAIWYLLEIAILFPFVSATAPSVAKTADFVAYYSAQTTNLLIWAAGASVVLLGRIAFSAGARASLRRSAGVRALADLALGAMVLGCF
jgi:hypothetical protein